MKRYSPKYLPLIIGAACAVGILIGGYLNFPDGRGKLFADDQPDQKLERLINYIKYDYVDDVNTDSIVDEAITRILKSLDPHSTYISQQNYPKVSEEMNGGFVGIGVRFFRLKDTVAVLQTLENSPAEKAGIKPGDRLISADQTPLSNSQISADSLKSILRGKRNSTVRLKVKRSGKDELLTIPVKRKQIPLTSIDAAFMLNDHLGYLKVNRFSEHTYDEFVNAMHTLEKRGARKITLDLRGNGGGYLKQAIKLVDQFLAKDKLILITKDREGKTQKTFAKGGGDFEESGVYVLIDQNTASASEVIAGALQDNDVGTIVGRRSFGKGMVQREMQLGDGSAVRLTVARYYTPTGRSIQKPYTKGDRKDYYNDYLNRYANGELVHEDSIHVNDSLKFITPKGKVVYGGGGIVPDVFVPKDVSYKKESLDYMLKGGVIDRYIFKLLDKKRSKYSAMSWKYFEADFKVTDTMIDDFITYLEGFQLHFKADKYRGLLKEYLKAAMAKQLFGSNAYQQIISHRDPMIKKVLTLDKE